jgi:iron complex outermembrane receptor protein
MTHITRVLIAAVAIAMAAFAQAAAAQTGQTALTGKVTDATGAVIVGATVTAINGDSDSRLRREATTTAEGTFVIERLPAGTYSVTAQADGFAPSRPQSITMTAGGRQTLVIELQIASLSETVTTVYGAKTGRSILDTPSSVGVIDGARMDASAMFRVEDVFRQMANVNRADWIDSGIVLRGINSEGVGGPSGSPLATTYVDGVPQTQNGARRGVNGTWDLQQVEVWRGPQSTIVGRNALAGAIQVKSNDPTMKWETAARLGFGTDTFNNQAVMVSGPIVDDKLAFRLAAEQQSRHGDVSYPPQFSALPKLEQRADDDYWMVRGKVLYRPTGSARTNILATVSSSYDSPSLSDVDGPSAGVSYEDRVWGLQTDPIFVEARATRNDIGSIDASFTLSDQWTLRSLTGYLVTDTQRPSIDLRTEGAFHEKQFTQEVILSQTSERFDTVVGLFMLDEHTTGDRDQARSWESFIRRDRSVTNVWNVAAYADTRWKVSGAGPWTVLAGLRLDREDQDFASTNSRVSNANGSTLTSSSSSTSASFSAPLPKAGISYALSETSALAFVAQRAYRAGGSAINFVTQTAYEYDPEYAWNYELSWRGQVVGLGRGLFQYRVNAFYLDWRDQQVNVPQVPGDFSSDIILNAGRSTVKGGEVELNWTSGRGLSVYTALGIADTTFKEFSFLQFGQLRDLTGDPFPQAPGVTANVGAQYQHRSGIFGGADITHAGSALSRSLLEAGLRDELPSYTLVNLRGGWTRGPWRLSVWADNLFDKLYFRYRYEEPNAQFATLGRGRVAGANLSVAF